MPVGHPNGKSLPPVTGFGTAGGISRFRAEFFLTMRKKLSGSAGKLGQMQGFRQDCHISMFTATKEVPQRTDLRRLAYELHDGPVQWLAAAVLDLEVVLAASSLEARLREKVQAAQGKMRRALQDLRALIRELEGESPAGSSVNIEALIRELCEHLEASEYRLKLSIRANLAALSPGCARNVLCVIQEALSNARRHSGSEELWISVLTVGKNLYICIRDFGKGLPAASELREGTGFRSMRERTAEAGGWITIEGAPQRGTRVFACFPLCK